MDDDNLSAPLTQGGAGGLTLHSKWKSQFDESEGSVNEIEMLHCLEQKKENISAEENIINKYNDTDLEVFKSSDSINPVQMTTITKQMIKEELPKYNLRQNGGSFLHPQQGKRLKKE